ncbi:MAG: hypothetical protein SFT91_04815, partial [Rickettsiaceae bacterium]|nr:hypothetical protein [Rickettsiaceae bacterium]
MLIKKNLMLKAGIIGTFALALIFLFASYDLNSEKNGPEYIGLIRVENIILEDKKFDTLLQDISESKNIKALVVMINSPGGSS